MKEKDALLRKLKPLLGSQAEALWLAAEVDRTVREDVERLLAVSALEVGETFESAHPCFEPPPVDTANGPYAVGKCVYAGSSLHGFGLREDEWIQHVGIFGRTGSGKTNAAFVLIEALLEHGKPILVLDWKRSYRDLLARWPERNILVFTVGRGVAPFYFNPLLPPEGTPPAAWAKKLIEVLCHAFFLGEGVAYLLLVAIDSVYRSCGVYGEMRKEPTFLDVRAWFDSFKPRGRQAQWMDSTMRLIGSLCFGEVSRVLNTRGALLIPELLARNVLLELDALNEAEKTFLMESLLLWIHHYRLHEADRETFKHAIFLEEAHHVLTRRQGSESVMDLILREIRELGEAVILIDQHPSLVSIPALGNTNCTLAMSLKHQRDLAAIGEALLLERNERPFLGRLPVGEAIVRLQSRWPKPFLMRVPLMPVKKGEVTDADVARRMRGYSERLGPLGVVDEGLWPSKGSEKREGERTQMTGEEEQLLKDVRKHPESTVVDRYRRLGWNAYKGTRVKKALTDRGLVQARETTTRKGRKVKLTLTKAGEEALGRGTGQSRRHGGEEHEAAKRQVLMILRRSGWLCQDEAPIGGGRTLDVLASKTGRRIAVEIETGKSDALHNVRRAIESGIPEVLVVATSSAVLSRLRNLFAEHLPSGALAGVDLCTPEEVQTSRLIQDLEIRHQPDGLRASSGRECQQSGTGLGRQHYPL